MTNPPEEPGPQKPSWSWEPNTGGAKPGEQQQAEAGLPQSPEPGEPIPSAGPAPGEGAEPPGDPGVAPPSPEPVLAAPVAEPPAAPPPWAAVADEQPLSDRYPMRFDVAYRYRMSRVRTAFRIVLILPAWAFAWLVAYFINVALLIGWTTVFFRRKYPSWLFQGLSGAYEHSARVWSYGALLTDKFPSFSRDDSPVFLEYDVPPSGYLSRWRVLFWKWVLLIPTFFVLGFLVLAVFAVTIIAWFAILLTGSFPRGMFQFSVGVQRWYFRAMGYFASFNDRYPPYSLAEDAGPASNAATVSSGVAGWVLGGGFLALTIVAAATAGKPITQEVDYARLSDGTGGVPVFFDSTALNDDGVIVFALERARDPGDAFVGILQPDRGERVVVFEWTILNFTRVSARVPLSAASLKYQYRETGETRTRTVDAEIVTVGSATPPVSIDPGGATRLFAVFVVPENAVPLELRFSGGFARVGGVKYVFE